MGGLDVEHDWDDQLSLREQRLLEIARMLLAAPSCAVLTRLGANLGAALAGQAVDALAARGIGVLALENDVPDVTRFDAVVTIAADGSWAQTGAKARA